MVAVYIVDHIPVKVRGENPENLVRLGTPVKNIAEHLDAVEQYLADGMGEMSNESVGNNTFFKNRIGYR